MRGDEIVGWDQVESELLQIDPPASQKRTRIKNWMFRMFFAYFLIIIGVAFLLRNLGLLPIGAWGIIWPSLLIAWGLSIIFGRNRYWWGWPRRGGVRSEGSKESQG